MVRGESWSGEEVLTSVGDLGHLVRVEQIPLLSGMSLCKGNNVDRHDEVDEGIANIAIVGKVDAKVHEVNLPTRGYEEHLLQHLLVDAIGDVPKHDL